MAESTTAAYPLLTSTLAPAGLHAKTRWFHLSRGLIDSGDLAKMEGATLKVLIAVKAHTDLHDGVSTPSEETLAKQTGLHPKSVSRALRQLQQIGRLSVAKEGRHNIYQFQEQVPLLDETGDTVGTATWPYIPSRMKEATDDLKQALTTGDLTHTTLVCIEITTPMEPPPPPPVSPEVDPVPASDEPVVPATIKDPELCGIVNRLGRLVMAAEAQRPTIGNPSVTYHAKQVTHRLPVAMQ